MYFFGSSFSASCRSGNSDTGTRIETQNPAFGRSESFQRLVLLSGNSDTGTRIETINSRRGYSRFRQGSGGSPEIPILVLGLKPFLVLLLNLLQKRSPEIPILVLGFVTFSEFIVVEFALGSIIHSKMGLLQRHLTGSQLRANFR